MRFTLSLLLLTSGMAAAQPGLYVDAAAPPGGYGTPGQPFRDLAPAVALANSQPGVTTIHIAPGVYPVTETILVTKNMIIKGSADLRSDRIAPTGDVKKNTATILETTGLAGGAPMILVAQAGEVLDGFQMHNLELRTTAAIGGLVELRRVQNFSIHDIVMNGPGGTNPPAGISTYASSGEIHTTYATGLQGSAFLAGGYPESPATVTYRSNRSVGNRVGIFLAGTSDGIPEPGDTLTARIQSNDLSSNVGAPLGTGIRMVIKGRETPEGTTGLSQGNITAIVQGNRIHDNVRPFALDAGFPTRVIPDTTLCDPRTFTGLMNLTFQGNTVTGNADKSLVTFMRLQAYTNNAQRALYKFLHSATFTISGQTGLFDANNAVIYNPPTDPFAGNCADPAPLNNTVVIP